MARSELVHELECPVCGSDQVRTRTEESPMGFLAINNYCLGCGEEGDFEVVNDASYDCMHKMWTELAYEHDVDAMAVRYS
jgi:DnaJ-class molecular chaperone